MVEVVTGDRLTTDGYAEQKAAPPADIIAMSSPKKVAFLNGKFKNSGPLPRRFQSTITGLMISVQNEKPKVTTDGQKVDGITHAVRFRNKRGRGFYETSDVAEIYAIENSRGYGMEIWDFDAFNENSKEAQRKAVMAQVYDDPVLAKRLGIKPDAKDFVTAAPPEPEESKPGKPEKKQKK